MAPPLIKRPEDYKAFRISTGDTNYMVCIADPIDEGVGFTLVVEIYDIGGKTPPNAHETAHELFFILAGSGMAHCDGVSAPITAGDSVLLPPGSTHVIENTGTTKLYALCLMVPNEDFAEMIHAGEPVPLDDADLSALRGLSVGGPAR